MKRFAIHARFSDEHVQDARSIPDQQALNRRRVDELGGIVVREFSEPDTFSGLPLHARPELLDLMDRAEAGEIDVVLTELVDRLARRPSVVNAVLEHLEHCGVEFWTLADGKVSDLHVAFRSVQARQFQRDLAQKVRRGQVGRVREGKVSGGHPSYGYQLKEREPGVLEVHEFRKQIVRRIFEHYDAGVGPKAIVMALEAEGIEGPRGPWKVGTIGGILRNPIYIGETIYNRKSQPKSPKTGRPVGRANPPDQWERGYNKDYVIVNPVFFQRVQERLASRPHQHPRQKRRPKHLLSGLLICGRCKEKLHIKTNGVGTRYFACSTHTKRGGCKNIRMLPAREAERRVLAGLLPRLLAPEAVALAASTYQEARKRLAAQQARTRNSTKHELADVQRRIANIDKISWRRIQLRAPPRARRAGGARDRVEGENALGGGRHSPPAPPGSAPLPAARREPGR